MLNLRILALAAVAFVAGLAYAVVPAGAGTPATSELRIVIPDGLIRGTPGIGVFVYAGEPVPAGLVGDQCAATFDAGNNDSIHPGTLVTVRSGGTEARMDDVEASAGKVTVGTGALVLGDAYDVLVFPGSDWIASLDGGTIVLDCTDPPPPTTTTSTTTTTTSSTTTTTTAPPPPTTTRPPLVDFCQRWFEWYPELCDPRTPPPVTPATPATPVVHPPDFTG